MVGGCVGSVEGPVPITRFPPLLRLRCCFAIFYHFFQLQPVQGPAVLYYFLLSLVIMDGELEKFVVLAKTAKGPAAVHLITQVLNNKKIFVVGDLLEMPNIQAV